MRRVFSLRVFLPFAIFAALSIQTCFAQQTAAPPAAGSTGTGTGTGSTGNAGAGGIVSRPGTTVPTQPQQQSTDPNNRFPDLQRQNVFLSGKVMLDDGTPPPESVIIERVCNGSVRAEGYTDSKGRFSFQLGQNSSMLMDASMSSVNDSGFGMPTNRGVTPTSSARGSSPISLVGCELRAALAGFRSDAVNLNGHRALDNPDVGTIVLHRLGKVDGFTFSGTSTYAPKDARKAYEKGKEAAKKQKWPEAEKELQKAVEIYPKYAVAWYELGAVNQAQKNFDEAKKDYAQSIAADSKYISPYGQLARLAAAEKNWKESAEYTDKLLKLNPYFSPEAYFINSISYLNLQNLDKAEEGAREALKMDAQHHNPKISQLLGVILAQKQDYPGAAENMRNYLKFAPNAPDAGTVKMQLTEVEKLLGAKADSKQP